MLLQGLIFAYLGWFLNGHSQIGRAIYASLMIWFFNGIGASTVIFFGGIVQMTIATMMIVKPFLAPVPPRDLATVQRFG